MNDRVLVTNIQRFSLHDGPGIRTTIFLKGCSLRCPWCCNPENLSPQPQQYLEKGECKTYGFYISCNEILEEVLKDKIYYDGELSDFNISDGKDLNKLPGGVTFSGGEALLQIQQLKPLLKSLNDKKIHLAIETSLFADADNLNLALKYIDLFYVDLKILDSAKCKNVQGGSLKLYLENLDRLFAYNDENGKQKPVVFRVPVICGYTDTEENKKAVLHLISKYTPLKVELIKGHNLGASKYASLGLQEPDYRVVSDVFLDEFFKEIEDNGIMAEICKV